MATKNEIKEELTKLGIAFDDAATFAELKALLPNTDSLSGATDTDPAPAAFAIEVNDPEIARPKVLPLVIKPANGADWQNPQQAKYAAILNSFAYQSPDKWAQEKDDRIDDVPTPTGTQKVAVKGLLTKLKEIGANPRLFVTYTGTQHDENEAKIVDKAAPKNIQA